MRIYSLPELLKIVKKDYPSIEFFEVEWVISHVLKISRIDIYTKSDITVTESQKDLISSYLERLSNKEPLQYILGEECFRELVLSVGPDVLVPRPETEQLVEKALQLLPTKKAKVMDIGTGSGAIALSIAHEAPHSFVTGVDISKDALEYARKNKERNKISNIEFIHGDLCKGLPENSFDMIIANLPYVTEEEFTKLDPNVKEFEPKLALTSGLDGLNLIQKLIPQALNALKPSGWLLLEIGYKQGKAVVELLKNNNFINIEVIQDFNQKDRIVVGQKACHKTR